MQMAQISERSWVEINLTALSDNLRYLKSFLDHEQDFMMIVKADAYGHGALEISRTALAEGAVYLGVANPEEGRLLRLQGITEPILVLSPSLFGEIEIIISNQLSVSVSDVAFAAALNVRAANAQTIVKVHLKADTGMHRSGVDWQEFLALFMQVEKLPNLHIEGVFSHFASSESDPEFSQAQEYRFNELLKSLPKKPKYIHIANSNAVINGLGASSNLVRLGIAAYGISINPASTGEKTLSQSLKPVMTFKTTLSQIKPIKKGESVGYNRTWKANKDGIYGILPIGYADGYDFMLSNRGTVQIGQKLLPVIGKISMDMICIDLCGAKELCVGEEAILLGGENHALRAENLVLHYNGNPYELLCQVGRRAKRFYYKQGKLVHSSPLSRRDFVPDDFSDTKLNQIIESAIAQRLQSNEIGELIYHEILRNFFYNKDKDIHYRHNFVHEIRFTDSSQEGYYQAITTLSFDKVLQNDYFIVACASSDEVLRRYFKRSDVEYRWLMDSDVELKPDSFSVSSVRINEHELETKTHHIKGCLEIKCSSPKLKEYQGKLVSFTINTQTLYPKASHQFSVFISELTKGTRIAFYPPPELKRVDCVPVFSGQDKYPRIVKHKNKIELISHPGEWIFPISGVVFAY